MSTVEPWLAGPLGRFVDESATRITLLMTAAGQVVAQHGFTRRVDVMAAAALGAGIVASTEAMARMLGAGGFATLAHQGRTQSLVLLPFATPRGRWIALVVFGRETTIGLVQVFLERLAAEVAADMPPEPARAPLTAERFEQELQDSLRNLFGRAS
ncbi:MAG: roadblock/LC7 domain-containing protein [Gemmatimonadales bacterium]|nr:roadblock/LC7 domain-containing protein [Gemmatimonadales bacterium]